MREKNQDRTEEKTSRSKRKSGAYCVYFTYKNKGSDDIIPQIVAYGSEEQCRKHIEDYNRQTLERYRCKLHAAPSKDILDRIAELKRKFGTVGTNQED